MDAKLQKLKDLKKSKMSNLEKDAKSSVLNSLKDLAQSEMGGKLKGLKKVTVASDSEEGLEKGLDLAKEKISEMPEMEEQENEYNEESEDKVAMMEEYMQDCSAEDLEKVIAKAQELLAQKKSM